MPEFTSALDEAMKLVHGKRQDEYGHPLDDFSRTASLWTEILGHPVAPGQVALCMIAVKLSRLVNTPGHHDSIVDIAGYAETYHMVQKESRRRSHDGTR